MGRTSRGRYGDRASNRPMSPALKAYRMSLSHSNSVLIREFNIGCINCQGQIRFAKSHQCSFSINRLSSLSDSRSHQFTEIVDRVGQQGRDGEVVCARHSFRRGQLGFDVDACQIEQGVLVVVSVFRFALELDNRMSTRCLCLALPPTSS